MSPREHIRRADQVELRIQGTIHGQSFDLTLHGSDPAKPVDNLLKAVKVIRDVATGKRDA